MKLRLSFSILFLCLLSVFAGTSNTSFAQAPASITEDKVMAIMNSVDRATRKGNIAGIVAPLASNVKIKMTVSTAKSDKEQVINLTKDQYTFFTKRAFRRRIAYQLERKNTRVKIYEGSQTAMVTSDLYESLTIPQGTLRAVSSEVAIFNLRDGRIWITSIDSRTRFY